MFVKRSKATLKRDKTAVKLGMDNMILTLMLAEPPLPLSDRNAYYYITKTNLLLVYLSWMQCKQELSFVADDFIVCHASQTLILTEYIWVVREYMMHYVRHHVLPRDRSINAQRTRTLCMNTILLCRKFNSNFSQISLLHKHRSGLFLLPPAHCCMRYMWQTWHYILCYSSRGSGSTSSFLRKQLSDQRPHVSLCFPNGSFSWFRPFPLRCTIAWPLHALLPFALDCKLQLPNYPFLFSSDPLCLS